MTAETGEVSEQRVESNRKKKEGKNMTGLIPEKDSTSGTRKQE